MIFLRLRRHRLTNKLLALLAAIWLSLALQPCAMAVVTMIPDQASAHSHCPKCPEQVKKSPDCSLSEWQLIKSVSGGSGPDAASPALAPFILLQYALWQPLTTPTAPPWPEIRPRNSDIPVYRQDILRL